MCITVFVTTPDAMTKRTGLGIKCLLKTRYKTNLFIKVNDVALNTGVNLGNVTDVAKT